MSPTYEKLLCRSLKGNYLVADEIGKHVHGQHVRENRAIGALRSDLHTKSI